MMALNRYRLKHLSKESSAARRAAKLLDRPDRLIGLILIGNNAVNILAALIAGIIFGRLFGEDAGVWATTILLTLIMLVFAEVTPKTMAAAHPERIAFPASRILQILMSIAGWIVVMLNALTNGIVRLLGVDPTQSNTLHMSSDELRTVVDEAGDLIPNQHQDMLRNILNLENMQVNDIMIPRSDITGIDLNDDIDTIVPIILNSEYTRLPIYRGDIDKIEGILHLKRINRALSAGTQKLTKDAIKRFSMEPYFIPESTPLNVQIMNFQQVRRRMGMVVDEYGAIMGLATMDDILEEIVGNFTTSIANDEILIRLEANNVMRVEGSAAVRDFNKLTNWDLPVGGPKTMGGFATELLEELPNGPTCFETQQLRFEITKVSEKLVDQLLIWSKES